MEQLKPVFDDLEHFEQQKRAAETRILQVLYDDYAGVCTGKLIYWYTAFIY